MGYITPQDYTPLNAGAAPNAVRVRACGRLHMGFIDPSGSLGRRFGSLGLVLQDPAVVVTVCPARRDELMAYGDHEDLPRMARHLQRLRQATGRDTPLRIELSQALPSHAGLGSGTQLALALGRAFAEVHGMTIDTPALAGLLGRGLRSGVGIAGFDQGGFLVDAGAAASGGPAPVLARLHFPDSWPVLLVQDTRRQGLHGAQEIEALAGLPPFARTHAAMVSHELMMRVLPAIIEHDFEPMAQGITHIQQLIGEHFAPAQDGRHYTSPDVERVMRWVESRCLAGVGQSSWGPTGFAVLPSPRVAQELLAQAQAEGLVSEGLRLQIVQARNQGAEVQGTL
jgi:beta-ribofuranosylaminobenzene 5'-phosphate synthase